MWSCAQEKESVIVGWLALVADCRVLLYQIARLHSIKCKDSSILAAGLEYVHVRDLFEDI
jgi:hypothetical protein